MLFRSYTLTRGKIHEMGIWGLVKEKAKCVKKKVTEKRTPPPPQAAYIQEMKFFSQHGTKSDTFCPKFKGNLQKSVVFCGKSVKKSSFFVVNIQGK